MWCSLDRRHDVCVPKIRTFEQQRFAADFCKRIGEAIAEIQLCRMSAAFAEISICVPGEPCLNFGDRLDEDLCLFEKVIEAPACDGITAAIDDRRGFDKIHCRDATFGGALDRTCANFRLRFVAKNGDER